MGRSVVKAALSHNDLVTAVGRTFENSLESMQNWHQGAPPPVAQSPSSLSPSTSKPGKPSPSKLPSGIDSPDTKPSSHCLGLLCDVRVRSTVDEVMKKSIAHWGRIDIIANCSGYGIIGAVEDQDEYEIRNQFETNFFGTLNIIQLSLPYFRERHEKEVTKQESRGGSSSGGEGGSPLSGRYLIFSSTSGALGVPGLGPYCATKYAVEGLIESMLYEIDSFGIRATLVEPGHVRRDDDPPISSSSNMTTNSNTTTTGTTDGLGKMNSLPTFGHFLIKPASEPYASPTAPAGHAKRMLQWLEGRQPTSAVKAAELVWQLGHCNYPPLRLLLGSFAVESVRDRLRSIIEEIEDWKHLSFRREEQDEEGGGEGGEAGGEDGKEQGDLDEMMDDGEMDGDGDGEGEGEGEGEGDADGEGDGEGDDGDGMDIKQEKDTDDNDGQPDGNEYHDHIDGHLHHRFDHGEGNKSGYAPEDNPMDS